MIVLTTTVCCIIIIKMAYKSYIHIHKMHAHLYCYLTFLFIFYRCKKDKNNHFTNEKLIGLPPFFQGSCIPSCINSMCHQGFL